MNFSPFRSISIYDSPVTKSTFPLQTESLPSSLSSFSSDQSSHHINFSNENLTYKIRKLKSLASSCDILQTSLLEKVIKTLDLISTDINDLALLDFCEFFSFCYKIAPREVISRIISVFQKNLFSANSLIVIAYIIKDFQEKPFDENSIQFFQSFIFESFMQLRKALISSTTSNSNSTTSSNSLNSSNSFNFKKFSNCFSLCFVDLQNPETFIPEDDFDFSNVDDTSLFLDNNNFNDDILSDNEDTIHTSTNLNSSITQNDTQNNSFLDTRNSDTSSSDSRETISTKTYKIFNCEFTHEQIFRFLLYLLRSKEMREDGSMRSSWFDFTELLSSQYEGRTEIAQFADYMISISKINMIPREMFMNHDFFELAKKENIVKVLQILSIEDLNKNCLLLAAVFNNFHDSEFATTFLKRCQELDYTLPPSFMNELTYSNEESLINENDQILNDEYILSEIINRINPNEFDSNLLYYLTRYKIKLNSIISSKLLSILGADFNESTIINFECLLQIMDSPLEYIEYEYLVPFIYNCTNADVFNSLTNNYPNNYKIITHPLFKDSKFWSQLISLFGFNSIQHFSKILIANNSENEKGHLIAKIFLENFPNNMKSSFYYFAKIVLSENRDIFSTCKETRELLSRFNNFYSVQFWRLFSKSNLIVEIIHSFQGRIDFNYMVLALSFVNINLCEENGISSGDPHILEMFLPSPPSPQLIEEIISFFKANELFKFDNMSNEVIQVLSVGHYFFNALIFRYQPFAINGYCPLYCLILLINIIYDVKHFKKAFFQQNKIFINQLLNKTSNMNNLKKIFEMDFFGKEQLVDIFLSSFGSKDDANYALNINDTDLKWIKYVFDNNSFLLPNLAYSKSLSYFFGQLTLCVNAFNCPITCKFISSKIDYLLRLFYLYPCPFFIINSDILEQFIFNIIQNEKPSFKLINFIMSSFSPINKSFALPNLDLNSMIIPFIKQNQISDISTIFDYCSQYMDCTSLVKLFKIPNLPLEIRAKYSYIFEFLSTEEIKEIFTVDRIKILVHTNKSSSFSGIIRIIEEILDDNDTVSNRTTFVTQVKKDVFSLGEDFNFPIRLAKKSAFDMTGINSAYSIDFLKGLYRVYEDSFVDYNNHVLIERLNFIPLSKNSEYSNIFLNELVKDAIQTNSWQMFTVLKSIANSHLFMFSNNDSENEIDLLGVFKYCIETINYINLNNLNDQFKLFITCNTFLSFLILSPCIADAFFNWIFSRFDEFNDNEFYYILYFIDMFLTNNITEIQMLAFCVKHNFISLMINHLQNTDKNLNDNPKVSLETESTTTFTTTQNQNRSESVFSDQMLYMDYEPFTVSENDDGNNDPDENIDSYMSSIQFNHESNEQSSTTQQTNQSYVFKPMKNDKINIEGIIKSSDKMKKQSYSLGLSIIKSIELLLSTFYDKSNVLKFIKFDEILKNSSPNPLYEGSYNNCWNIFSFRPFSNSFPRDISIPNFVPKSFSKCLTDLKSSLANIDFIESLIQSKLLGDIDKEEMKIKINYLRDPYLKVPINLNCPVDPKESESTLSNHISVGSNTSSSSSFLQWGLTNETNPGQQSILLKDIIGYDNDDFELLDEGGQTALLRKSLPPIPDINDPFIYRFLLKMPSWAGVILSNSPVRAILPPCYLIELYRIVAIINNETQKKIKGKKIKNSDIDINPCNFLYELECKNKTIELKMEFISKLMQNKNHTPLNKVKEICNILLSDSTKHNEQIIKKVFLLGNKYISINSNIDTVICILSAFESLKKSMFFAQNFSDLSALHIYEELGKSCVSISDIAILACSLYSGLGNLISDIGIQFFEICLEMNDSKIYECLDYIAVIPEKEREKLTNKICNLIDDEQLLDNIKKIIDDPSTFLPKNEVTNENNTLSLIEKVVKNFHSIVKVKSSRFYEILSCILSKGKYLHIIGQIANILCPPKIPQNKLKVPTSSSTSTQPSSTHTPTMLPTPIIMNSSLAINPIIQPQVNQPQIPQPQQNQDPLKNTNLSISLTDQDDECALSYGVPNYIYKTCPEFWKVIGPFMPIFNNLIESDLKNLQVELSFLKAYPEVLSFHCKLLLFHKIQCIQQTKQQRQLQKEYHKRGGAFAFNSVIMTINNSNNNNSNSNGSNSTTSSTNSISFINGNNSQNIPTTRSTPRGNSTMISFLNEQTRTQSLPASSLSHPFQSSQTSISSNAHPNDRVYRRTTSFSMMNNSTNANNENEDTRSTNTNTLQNGIIRPMIKVRRSHVLADTYSVFGPAFGELGFSIMPVRDIFVRFTGEPGIDLGGLTKDWISSTIKEIFNQDYYLFKQTTDGFSLFPNPSSSVNPEHLGYFELAGRIIAISLAKDINIDAHLALPFLKSLLEKKANIKDLERVDNQIYNSLVSIMKSDDIEELDMYFVVDIERSLGIVETVDLIENGKNIKVTNENKISFVASMANFYLYSSVENQIKAFKKGFYSIIPHSLIEMFTPTELDLLISGTNVIDVEDMKKNCSYEKPYHKNHPVVKLFFNCINKWSQEELHLLLRFITGLAHMPVGGFAAMAEKKKPLTISHGGDRDRLPQAHTCFNRIDIPAYQNEKELNEKLHYSIYECDNFLLI